MGEVGGAGEGGAIRDQRSRCSSAQRGRGNAVELGQGGGGGGGGGEEPLQGAVAEQWVGGEEEGGRRGEVGHLKGHLVRQTMFLAPRRKRSDF